MGDERGGSQSEVQVFLIADIRGYTRFTQARGDAAAAELASKFATIVDRFVQAHGGRLMELRGDEALAAFGSPRRAIAAALELQAQFLKESTEDPSLPLGVGIGIDVGEAVEVGEGYRGAALNVAARLCARARAGEVLATREVTHLARTIPDVRYERQPAVVLKGIEGPVDFMKVTPAGEDLATAFRTLMPPPADAQPGSRRMVVLGALAVAALASIGAWALLRDGAADRIDVARGVALLDADSAEIVSSIDAAAGPLAVVGNEVWVANTGDDSISKLDPEVDRVIENIDVGSDPSGLTFGFDALWVANAGDGSVSRVNLATNSVVQTIEVGNAPSSVAVGEGSIWVTNHYDDTVSRIDPTNGRVTSTIDVDDGPVSIVVHDRYVWAVNEFSSTVSRIDPRTDEVTSVIAVGNGPTAVVASGASSIWVPNSSDDTVSRIDTGTGRVTATVPVGKTPSAVAANDQFVWVGAEQDTTISKIDASEATTIETIDVAGRPAALAFVDDSLWLSVDPLAGRRGGTLRMVGAENAFEVEGGVLDPALAYSTAAWKIVTVTHDGLVDYKRVGGPDGTTIVPNLAVALPTVSDDGRTYTFELHDGVRFSTGEAVRPSDVKSSMERVVGLHVTSYFDSIRGADKCDRKRCDLSDGILIDDAANTVAFRLAKTDPEFLYKLALPFTSVVPEGTPVELQPGDTLPGTGPYRFAEYRPGERMRLDRNQHFEPWAPAAQGDGNVDEIVIDLDAGTNRTDPIIEGTADASLEQADEKDTPELRTRFADQLHVQPFPATFYMFLNTNVRPFNDVDVRRAVNLATDRDHLVRLFGGPERAAATCQNLPPNFPGYEPWCAYTLDPDRFGAWKGPDMSRAQRLVARSGTSGARVDVWRPGSDPFLPEGIGEYFEKLLDSLGYDARLRVFKDQGEYFSYITDSKSRAQIGIFGWASDYPAPSNFFLMTLRCDAFLRNDPMNANVAGFCDPQIDKRMDAALRTQRTDPAGAAQAWAEIDQAVMEQAPIVPMVNLNTAEFVSDRVEDVVLHPVWGGLLLDEVSLSSEQ